MYSMTKRMTDSAPGTVPSEPYRWTDLQHVQQLRVLLPNNLCLLSLQILVAFIVIIQYTIIYI